MAKVCPKCGHSNNDMDIYCKMCAQPLTKTHHLSIEVEGPKVEICPIQEQWVRICPSCGASNPDSRILCMECSFSLTNVKPVYTRIIREKQDELLDRQEKKRALRLVIITLVCSVITLAIGLVVLLSGGNIAYYFGGVISIFLGIQGLYDPQKMVQHEYGRILKNVELTSYGIFRNEIGCIIAIFFGLLFLVVSMLT